MELLVAAERLPAPKGRALASRFFDRMMKARTTFG